LSFSSDASDPAFVTESASAADKISTSTTSFEPIYLLIKSKFSRRTSISTNGSLKFRAWGPSAIASSFLNLKKSVHNFWVRFNSEDWSTELCCKATIISESGAKVQESSLNLFLRILRHSAFQPSNCSFTYIKHEYLISVCDTTGAPFLFPLWWAWELPASAKDNRVASAENSSIASRLGHFLRIEH